MKILKTYPLLLPIIFLFLIIVIMGYTIYDDSRIIVVRQDVMIEGLPSEFDGFTILQISDLHSHRFGESQQSITSIINSLDYDVIAFTGDMQDSRTQDILPFLELIRGIEKKTPMYYISGNTGPFDVLYSTMPDAQYNFDISTGKILDFGILLENENCTLLNQPQVIERGEKIWFAADFSPLVSKEVVKKAQQALQIATNQGQKIYLQGIIEYQMSLQHIYGTFQTSDTLIGIFHFPLFYDTLENPQGLPPYDLILAGHYHGGQIRFPLLGSIYIPDASLPRHGFFPPQNLVSGLVKMNNLQEYITRGLGASSHHIFLQFRLFNTPEINLIKLRRSEH
jgi:predicted MPP superfamily phosphohydrolase